MNIRMFLGSWVSVFNQEQKLSLLFLPMLEKVRSTLLHSAGDDLINLTF